LVDLLEVGVEGEFAEDALFLGGDFELNSKGATLDRKSRLVQPTSPYSAIAAILFLFQAQLKRKLMITLFLSDTPEGSWLVHPLAFVVARLPPRAGYVFYWFLINSIVEKEKIARK
jgi:hypothetical protein